MEAQHTARLRLQRPVPALHGKPERGAQLAEHFGRGVEHSGEVEPNSRLHPPILALPSELKRDFELLPGLAGQAELAHGQPEPVIQLGVQGETQLPAVLDRMSEMHQCLLRFAGEVMDAAEVADGANGPIAVAYPMLQLGGFAEADDGLAVGTQPPVHVGGAYEDRGEHFLIGRRLRVEPRLRQHR